MSKNNKSRKMSASKSHEVESDHEDEQSIKTVQYTYSLLDDLPDLHKRSINELQSIFINMGIHEGLMTDDRQTLIEDIWRGYSLRERDDPDPSNNERKRGSACCYPAKVRGEDGSKTESYYLDTNRVRSRARRLHLVLKSEFTRDEMFDALENRYTPEMMKFFKKRYLNELVRHLGMVAHSINKEQDGDLLPKEKLVSHIVASRFDARLLSGERIESNLRSLGMKNFTNPIPTSVEEEEKNGKITRTYSYDPREVERFNSLGKKDRLIEIWNNRFSPDKLFISHYYSSKGLEDRLTSLGGQPPVGTGKVRTTKKKGDPTEHPVLDKDGNELRVVTRDDRVNALSKYLESFDPVEHEFEEFYGLKPRSPLEAPRGYTSSSRKTPSSVSQQVSVEKPKKRTRARTGQRVNR